MFQRSSLAKIVALWMCSKAELMSGNGHLFLTVMLFIPYNKCRRLTLLGNEEEVSTYRGGGRMDDAGSQ